MSDGMPHLPGEPGSTPAAQAPLPVLTRLHVILRNLVYFRGANIAVIVGMAVATAVLTGALLVGDSVRGSLRALALQRLGPIDHALVAPTFVPQSLAERMAGHREFGGRFQSIAPAISVRGSASDEAGGARTAGVQISAVSGRSGLLDIPAGQAVLNANLAGVLEATAGESVLFSLPVPDETPRDATLSRRSRTDVTSGLRAEVRSVASAPGVVSLFSVAGTQRPPLNAWVNLEDLQDAIRQAGRVNLLLVQAKEGNKTEEAAAELNAMLREVVSLEDLGLTLGMSPDKSEAILNSRTTYLAPPVAQAASDAAQAVGARVTRVTVYLANRVDRVGSEAGEPATRPEPLHYCIVAGMDSLSLAADEVALNAWTAEQLGAKVGDRIRFSYYRRQADSQLKEVVSPVAFRVARILPMSGVGADPSLTPTFKGFTDADTVASWEAPEGVEINKRLVTPEDEEYWEKHKAAPKLFVSLEAARGLWSNPFGDLTSVRVPAAKAEAFSRALRDRLDPASLGLSFVPIKARQLAAASGSTDFSGLFIGFSFFLIVAAALLVAMLFRLAIEQRSRQFGLLAALGFSPRSLLRLAFAEGLILAAIGALIGSGLAVGYTGLMIVGLRTWWRDAVGTTALQTHVSSMTLLIGFVAAMAVAAAAVYWAVRRLGRSTAVSLLSGSWVAADAAGPVRGVDASARRRIPAYALMAAAILVAAHGLLLAGALSPKLAQPLLLGAGFLFLVGCLLFTWLRLRMVRRGRASQSLTVLALRNARRHRARSLTAVALIAFASFTLVLVASMRQPPPAHTREKRSGTGGYQLILTADIPLTGDLNSRKARDLLGFREADSPLLGSAQFTSLRSWAGQDASCLNLTRPTSPTILAVPPAMAAANPFEFAGTIAEVENPWTLLDGSRRGDHASAIPVIADSETAAYILKLGIGETLAIHDQLGRRQELLLVGTLSHSIFQSELLMSEADFLRLFPSQSGYGTVLVSCPVEQIEPLQRLLSAELADFSVTVEPAAQRLARYQQVANTYLSTFQALGSLGLMLGTIGLGVILLRNLLERRPELALLSALGFGPGSRVYLILTENALLLLLGLLIGTVSALAAVVPAGRPLNYGQLALTLGLTLAVGLATLVLATAYSSRAITAASLRSE